MAFTKSILSAALFAALAHGHGHVKAITSGSNQYVGGLPHAAPADAVGWAAGNQDNGFVEPNSFGDPDIICHKGATPASNSVSVAAGGTITLQWDTWPESHKGPVIDYIAKCPGDCSSVDKTSLSWVKIAEAGLISGTAPGTWAADELITNGFTWDVQIPASLAPGGYVLRHEIIALHGAGSANGAQAYPQCINLEVTGSGSSTPSGGVAGTSLYTATDPGILFNLYTNFDSYPVPGPSVWQG